MKHARIKIMPYQYPVVILGSRQSKHTNISSFTNPTTLTNNRFNSSTKEDNVIVLNYDEESLSRFKRDDSYGSSGYGHSFCPEGIPVETALFATLGAAALAFGILFMAVTMKTGGRKRKKRDSYDYDSYIENETSIPFSRVLSDFIYQGSLSTRCRIQVM